MRSVVVQEVLFQEVPPLTKENERQVVLLLGDAEYALTGAWQWQLHTDTVFCSDALLSLPPSCEGARTLLHPDDVAELRAQLLSPGGATIPQLAFRVIGGRGTVEHLTGTGITVHAGARVQNALDAHREEALARMEQARLLQLLQLQKLAADHNERATVSGSWWLNTATGQMHYSDGMFRLYGLPAQSLNAHPQTFASFLHPEDRDVVTDTLMRALKEGYSLELRFRAIAATGAQKTLQLQLRWSHTDNGQPLALGTVQDVTAIAGLEQRAESAAGESLLATRLLRLTEVTTQCGHWEYRPGTRGLSFSETHLRLHGLRPGATLAQVLSAVHPDDRNALQAAFQKAHKETPADLDYRLLRADGKVRYLQQRCKLLHEGPDTVLAGTVEDVTLALSAERFRSEARAQLQEGGALMAGTEGHASAGHWTWEEGSDTFTGSEGFFRLLGQRGPIANYSFRHFLKAVHPADAAALRDAWDLFVADRQESETRFRLRRGAEELQLAARFQVLAGSGRTLLAAFLRNETAQHALQQELTGQASLLSSLSAHIPDQLVITDTHNNIVFWNPRCEAAYRLKEEQVLQRNLFDVLPQLKETGLPAHLETALGGTPVELQTVQPPGTRDAYFNILLRPLRAPDGTVTGVLHVLHDVSREHDMQQRLSERLNFIEGLIEASVDRIIVMDRQMNYLYCNGRAAAFYGLEPGELIGRNVLEIFPQSLHAPAYEHFRRALKGETVHVPAIEGGLKEHYSEIYLIPVKNEAGTVTAVLWIYHDLGRELALQQQLQHSDEIINNINAAIIELDNEYRIRYINNKGLEWLGQEREALIGKVPMELYPDQHDAAAAQACVRALEEGERTDSEYYSHVFGRALFLSVTPSPQGGVLLFMYDRDDLEAARRALKLEHERLEQSEALLHAAEEVAGTGSYELDLATGEMRFSDGMFRLLGAAPRSFEPSLAAMERVTHPDDVSPMKAVLERATRDGHPYAYRRRIFRSDGEERLLECHGKVLADADGRPVKIQGVAQDITERVATEEALRSQEHFIAQVTDATPDFIMVFDLDERRIVYVNRAPYGADEARYRETLQLDYSGILARAYPDDRAPLDAFLMGFRAAPDNEPRTLEYRVQRPEGLLWYKVTAKVFRRDAEGVPQQIIEVIHDITHEVSLRRASAKV